jgi:uncharacterized protein (DUF1501 family)
MQPTRRDLLRLGMGPAALLACGTTVPGFLARSATALAAGPGQAGNVLVVVQLDGGNDGLNTVVPFKDPDYRKHRPRLNLAAARLHRMDDHVGFHPTLTGFARLLQNRQLAVIQSVGYPNPSRSHFQSMAIWHTAQLGSEPHAPGWLARQLDQRRSEPAADTPALHVSDALLPQALAGSPQHVPSLVSLEQFRRRLGVPEQAGAAGQRAALDQLAGQQHGEPGSLLQFVERSTLLSYTSSARLEGILAGKTAPAGYPEGFGLARRLRLVAQLIKAGLTTSLYYTQLGGFDTHANQDGTHASLLQELGTSLQAFLDDLTRAGDAGRVLVLVFSEFGRRLTENASAGTDHGTAAPVFLLGGAVKAGVHGPYPNLQDLDAGGDPRHAIDFRRVYATILDRWLGCPAEKVLGAPFDPLPGEVLRSGR